LQIANKLLPGSQRHDSAAVIILALSEWSEHDAPIRHSNRHSTWFAGRVGGSRANCSALCSIRHIRMVVFSKSLSTISIWQMHERLRASTHARDASYLACWISSAEPKCIGRLSLNLRRNYRRWSRSFRHSNRASALSISHRASLPEDTTTPCVRRTVEYSPQMKSRSS
jgi:hypothetical protein